jgi:hypothetical protein
MNSAVSIFSVLIYVPLYHVVGISELPEAGVLKMELCRLS